MKSRGALLVIVGLAVVGLGCAPAIAPLPVPAPPPAPPPPPMAMSDTSPDIAPSPVVMSVSSPETGPCIIEGAAYAAVTCPEDAIPLHAAVLLGCPANQIAVRLVSTGGTRDATYSVFAEGCGDRVVYSSSALSVWKAPEKAARMSLVYSRKPSQEWFVTSRFALVRATSHGAP